LQPPQSSARRCAASARADRRALSLLLMLMLLLLLLMLLLVLLMLLLMLMLTVTLPMLLLVMAMVMMMLQGWAEATPDHQQHHRFHQQHLEPPNALCQPCEEEAS
jgi:hypothetical protein